jgi:hypothetical protein
LQEWKSGTPPQGKYLLDTGRSQHNVDVGHGIFEWDGTVHTIEYAFEIGKLLGPIPQKEEKGMKTVTKETKLPDIPGLTAEADAEIRQALREMAKVQARIVPQSIAPQLAAAYGEDIQAVREQKHGWQKIARIFRAHGLRIGEKSLKARVEA